MLTSTERHISSIYLTRDGVDVEGHFRQSAHRSAVTLSLSSGPSRLQTECERGVIPHSIQILLPELKQRLGEVAKEQTVIVYCHSGQRSYIACRILVRNGYKGKNLSGSYATWSPQQFLAATRSRDHSGEVVVAAH